MSKSPRRTLPPEATSAEAEVFARTVADLVVIDAEKRAKLCLYRDLLVRWNSRMNLMSERDVHRFWSRHCWESIQLLRFLPSEGGEVCDLGSGAGFPGLVLALLSERNHFTLIESRQKKASFLHHVSRETCTPVRVETARVEEIPRTCDLVVSRAFASLDKTLQRLETWRIGEHRDASSGDFRALFLKGSRWQQELATAQQSWTIRACVGNLQPMDRLSAEQKKQHGQQFTEKHTEKHSCVILKLREWSRDRTNFPIL